MTRCTFKQGNYNCGSYAFNLYKEDIDQGSYCDRHYWQDQAQNARADEREKRMKEWIEYLKRKSDFGQHMKIPSEMSAGTCWELALELEQFINTTPPQRTWVGLTKEQISEFNTWHDNREEEVGWVNPSEIVAYIDAKLKQKNGYAKEKNT